MTTTIIKVVHNSDIDNQTITVNEQKKLQAVGSEFVLRKVIDPVEIFAKEPNKIYWVEDGRYEVNGTGTYADLKEIKEAIIPAFNVEVVPEHFNIDYNYVMSRARRLELVLPRVSATTTTTTINHITHVVPDSQIVHGMTSFDVPKLEDGDSSYYYSYEPTTYTLDVPIKVHKFVQMLLPQVTESGQTQQFDFTEQVGDLTVHTTGSYQLSKVGSTLTSSITGQIHITGDGIDVAHQLHELPVQVFDDTTHTIEDSNVVLKLGDVGKMVSAAVFDIDLGEDKAPLYVSLLSHTTTDILYTI